MELKFCSIVCFHILEIYYFTKFFRLHFTSIKVCVYNLLYILIMYYKDVLMQILVSYDIGLDLLTDTYMENGHVEKHF